MPPPSAQQGDQQPYQHPLFNNTIYTLRRLSPLYIGHGPSTGLSQSHFNTVSRHGYPSLPSEDFLNHHAGRFEGNLRGEIVPGVSLDGLYSDDIDCGGIAGNANGATEKDGALVACRWEVYNGLFHQQKAGRLSTERQRAGRGQSKGGVHRGVHIQVVYEKAAYHAYLLRDDKRDDGNGNMQRSASIHGSSDESDESDDDNGDSFIRLSVGRAKRRRTEHASRGDGFLSLPLLLFQMPTPLVHALTEYLESTFDARTSKLRLSTSPNLASSHVSDGFAGRARDMDPASRGQETGRGMGLAAFLGGYISSLLEEPRPNVRADPAGRSRPARPSATITPSLIVEVIQDTQFTFLFPPPIAPALRSMEVSVPKDDLVMFLPKKMDRGTGMEKSGKRAAGRAAAADPAAPDDDVGFLESGRRRRGETENGGPLALEGKGHEWITKRLFEFLRQHLSLVPTLSIPRSALAATQEEGHEHAASIADTAPHPLMATTNGNRNADGRRHSTTTAASSMPAHDPATLASSSMTSRRPITLSSFIPGPPGVLAPTAPLSTLTKTQLKDAHESDDRLFNFSVPSTSNAEASPNNIPSASAAASAAAAASAVGARNPKQTPNTDRASQKSGPPQQSAHPRQQSRDDDLFITLSKISCACFVLWAHGRVKMVDPFDRAFAGLGLELGLGMEVEERVKSEGQEDGLGDAVDAIDAVNATDDAYRAGPRSRAARRRAPTSGIRNTPTFAADIEEEQERDEVGLRVMHATNAFLSALIERAEGGLMH
ncbi:MAG: hypothetical protein M1815_005875 [Lichina confinis]|nr:MAG: hypothetical protein M1815_005875 [Lichina confinis]